MVTCTRFITILQVYVLNFKVQMSMNHELYRFLSTKQNTVHTYTHTSCGIYNIYTMGTHVDAFFYKT